MKTYKDILFDRGRISEEKLSKILSTMLIIKMNELNSRGVKFIRIILYEQNNMTKNNETSKQFTEKYPET